MRNRISDLQKKPTVYIRKDGQKCHESLLRAHGILQLVKRYLEDAAPPEIILDVIYHIENSDEAQPDDGGEI